MSTETEFVNGLIFKAPNENAPEYVKGKGSIRVAELITWLQSRTGEWVNFDVKVSQGGKWYCAVDNWKPKQEGGAPQQSAPRREVPTADNFEDDGINF